MVLIGGHRDAWGPGTADNVSGTVSVLEAARAIAEQVKRGMRPKRTIVFATWDAEEWGLIGSVEYVEDDSLRLTKGAVAYFNQDVAAQGPRFGGGGSPSLRAVLRDVARAVPDPNGHGSVYQEWRRANAVPDSLEPAMGDPGGGSDFAPFYNHLGIPIAEWGFGGAGGVYHSQYDDYTWMSKFGDPGFVYHATAARIASAMVLRVERALTRAEGLRTRSWFRNLIYVADENNGYANMVLPSVNEAIRSGDAALVSREISDLAGRFDEATRALDDARRAISAASSN